MPVHHLVRNNAIINTPLGKANCFAETLEQIHQVPDHPHFDDVFFASTTSCYRSPPDEDQTVRRRHRRVDKPEKPSIAARILQGYLDDITTWTNTWRIKPNPLKSQSILMSYSEANNSRSRHQAPHFLLNNQAIPKLQHIRYLGVTFSKNCTLNQDVKETLKKSRNRANLLYRIRGRIRGCDPKTLYHTYKTFIRPVIEYRAPIYATLYPARLQQISACERRMLRRIFRLSGRFPSDNLHQETNTTPIQSRFKELQSRYVTRILNSNNALAIQTLSTSYKYPSRDGRLLNRIPKIPKLKHPPNSSPLTSLHRTTGRPPGACGLDSLDHAVTVEDDETLGTQDIYTGKPF
jgi:hypothetical protein